MKRFWKYGFACLIFLSFFLSIDKQSASAEDEDIKYWEGVKWSSGLKGIIVPKEREKIFKEVEGKKEFVRYTKSGEKLKVYKYSKNENSVRYGLGAGLFILDDNNRIYYKKQPSVVENFTVIDDT